MKKVACTLLRKKSIASIMAVAVLTALALAFFASCGAAVDIGAANSVLTSFQLDWPGGFDGGCNSGEPISIVISALDQNGTVFSWTETVTLSSTNTFVAVTPAATVTNGTVVTSISFTNSTGSNQDTKLKITFGGTVREVPETVTVYETTPPDNVNFFSSTAWDGQVGLSWANPPSDFEGVKVLRKEGESPFNAEDGTLVYDGGGTSCVDTDLANGTTYFYSAFAYDAYENYASGTTATGTPEVHSVNLLSAFPIDEKVTLRWTEDADADDYSIYYTDDGTDPDPATSSSVSGIGTTSYQVDSLTNFTQYRFAVTVVKGGMDSGISNILAVKPPGEPIVGIYTHSIALLDEGYIKIWGRNNYGQLGDGTEDETHMAKALTGVEDVVSVAAGSYHTIALLTDGTIKAWGRNDRGELGDGTFADNSSPVTVSGITSAIAVSTKGWHSLALLSDGTVKAWGGGTAGQCGDGVLSNKGSPVTVTTDGSTQLDGVVAISAGASSSYAILSDGTVMAWGNNGYGELGIGSSPAYTTYAVPVPGLSGVVAIEGGNNSAAAVLSDGTAKSWGYNEYGKLGDGTTNTRYTPVDVKADVPNPLQGIVAVAMGVSHTLALMDDGTLKGWGRNSASGAIGDGTTITRNYPVPVNDITNAVAVEAGYGCSIASLSDGSLYAWGDNGFGQLGDNMEVPYSLSPQRVLTFGDVIQVSSSYKHNLGLIDDGTVIAWGFGEMGQLGDGTLATDHQREIPVTVEGLTGVVEVAAGGYHSLARLSDGTMKAWGYNTFGQLGNNETTNRATPVMVTTDGTNPLQNVDAIAGGHTNSFALLTDGTIRGWGQNYGNMDMSALGANLTSDYELLPVQVSGITTAKAVAAAGLHNLALLTDNTVRSWGYNNSGQLGDGTTTKTYVPVTVKADVSTTLSNVVAIAANNEHSLAIVSLNTGRAWGENTYGRLGDGSTTDRSYPVTVTGLSGAVEIEGGHYHSLAVLSDGTMRAWGRNDYGQLGDGLTSMSPTPVTVSGITDAVSAAAGSLFSLALLSDGTVKAWGYNYYGVIGDGTTLDRHEPVAVKTMTKALH